MTDRHAKAVRRRHANLYADCSGVAPFIAFFSGLPPAQDNRPDDRMDTLANDIVVTAAKTKSLVAKTSQAISVVATGELTR